ncbi:hypothetical protein ACA910_015888 [Epithemia clementina (nom. ined.)]
MLHLLLLSSAAASSRVSCGFSFSASMALLAFGGVDGFLPHRQQEGRQTVLASSSRAAFFMPLHQTPSLSDGGDNDMGGGLANNGSNEADNSHRHLSSSSASSSQRSQLQRQYPMTNGKHVEVNHLHDNNNNSTMDGSAVNHNNNNSNNNHQSNQREILLQQRLTQLEELVARQAVDIKRLQEECHDLTEAAAAFAQVVELLRASGLKSEADRLQSSKTKKGDNQQAKDPSSIASFLDYKQQDEENEDEEPVVCFGDDSDIFGKAPANVMEAADAAGAAILAAMLGGQQRLLVDVRDAELTSNAETLVQFLELAILPVAAGLEGLRSKRNRLKIVFPTVKQLLQYRKTMALAAPEVVALSTLNLDPVEPQDNLVVIVAPAPDDEEGCQVMNQLLQPPDDSSANDINIKRTKRDDEDYDDDSPSTPTRGIRQPVVVFNPHMAPVEGPAASYEVAYQLRILSVQYMLSPARPGKGYVQHRDLNKKKQDDSTGKNSVKDTKDGDDSDEEQNVPARKPQPPSRSASRGYTGSGARGTTRAMVIRAYPNPWHVFVDTSPDTDADFAIAGTFDQMPSSDDVQLAIIESLEGSEREDEIVAQQMQQALEAGQLDRVYEMLGDMGLDIFDDEEEDEDLDDPWGLYGVDSV